MIFYPCCRRTFVSCIHVLVLKSKIPNNSLFVDSKVGSLYLDILHCRPNLATIFFWKVQQKISLPTLQDTSWRPLDHPLECYDYDMTRPWLSKIKSNKCLLESSYPVNQPITVLPVISIFIIMPCGVLHLDNWWWLPVPYTKLKYSWVSFEFQGEIPYLWELLIWGEVKF